jgi:hypothetical protein
MNIQTRLLAWTLDVKKHVLAIPNSKTVYYWECDLLSVTRAGFTHEFEIKRTMSDYKADKRKIYKHRSLAGLRSNTRGRYTIPNYFWYATVDFDITPPEYAGWIKFMDTGGDRPMQIIKVEAPRLHNDHLPDKHIKTIGRIACYRMKDLFVKYRSPASLK